MSRRRIVVGVVLVLLVLMMLDLRYDIFGVGSTPVVVLNVEGRDPLHLLFVGR